MWPETEMVALQSPRDRKRKWWRFNRHVTGNGNGCASKSRDLGCFRFTSCSLFCSGLFPDFLIIYCWLYRDIFHCQSPDPVVGRANYILFWVQTLLVADLWFSVGFSFHAISALENQLLRGRREAYVVIIANFHITSPNLILFGSITPLFMWWVWWVKNFESFIFKTPSWLGN